ncbi:MAG: homoserine O-acetyltransferase [Rhodospirillales bacterium]|nr:homoserine O-acetyltransferase [Rhodospirillales bacterium]
MRIHRLAALAVVTLAFAAPALALDAIVEKKVFTLPSFTTMNGETIKYVRVGYETYGTLNAAKDNAILIPHFFSGSSHAAGKYAASDAAPGYWDAIIGPGKPIDTNKYFVLSSDTLVNLSTKDPNVITTGPATINPDTGKPYGMSFPIVTIRDFVNVQKALVDSMGITKLHAVIGASMGALQTFEWGAAYPDAVARIVPVIGGPELDAFAVGWLDLWAEPIRLDANWNKGDYYGKAEPIAGLTAALKVVTWHARYWQWAETALGRKWASPDKDPAKSWDNKYAAQTWLETAAAGRAKVSDANHFLYLVKANQLYSLGSKGNWEEGLKAIKAKVLLMPAKTDLIFFPDFSKRAAAKLKELGKTVDLVEIEGTLGHLDGLVAIPKVGDRLATFLSD